MKHAKFFSLFIFSIAMIYGLVGFYCLPYASFQGDLTRIGMLPESLFGWAKSQPVINPAHMAQSSWHEADIFVVGDSFSEPRIWQTSLTSRGLKVHTENWNYVHGICEDFSAWLRAKGFKGRYVVIESIERDAWHHFGSSHRCRGMDWQSRTKLSSKKVLPPIANFHPDQNNYSGKVSVGIRTWINKIRYERKTSNPDFKAYTQGSVRIARVPEGCTLFSHQRCLDSLFISLDKEQDLEDELLDNLVNLSAGQGGLKIVWAIVPNKSTAYLHPDKYFWDKLERRLRAVNLLKTVRLAIERKMVDIYPANNTHFSTSGYLLMGEAIYQIIQQEQAFDMTSKL